MSMDDRDEALANLLEARAGRLVNAKRPPLDREDETEVESLIEVADLLWEAGHGAPPLASDPVAAMLGLIPDRRVSLDSNALARARQNAKLRPSELVNRLRARGWDVQGRDVFQWETQPASDLAPALIRAIAEEIGTDMDRITTTRPTDAEPTAVATVTRSRAFEALVERWARVQGMSRAMAASVLEARMLTTVHRGDRPDADQLLRSLDALVTAVERGRRHDGS